MPLSSPAKASLLDRPHLAVHDGRQPPSPAVHFERRQRVQWGVGVAPVARAKQPLHAVDLCLATDPYLDVAFLGGACSAPATVQCCFGPAQSLLAHCTAGQ